MYLELSPPSSNTDRKSTRLNSSHLAISYAVFCLKKKDRGSSLTSPYLWVTDRDHARRAFNHERLVIRVCFFFNDTATTEIYTLSLHDALPIYRPRKENTYRIPWQSSRK